MIYNFILGLSDYSKLSILLTIINVFVLLTLLSLYLYNKKSKQEWSKVNDYLGVVTKTVDSVRYGDLTKKIDKNDFPRSEELSESLNRMIETLYDREKMIIEYQTDLRRQNKLMEAVLNSLSDGLIVFDEKQTILRATKKISEWFEDDGKNIIGKSLYDYISLAKNEKIESLKDSVINVLADDISIFHATTLELKLEDKKKRYILIIRNMTNQKELENLKEDFIATLTHDLKVPIIAETNMLELLLNESFGPISEKQTLAIKNMQSSNKDLLELVQTVLDTYKYKDGNIRLYKENVMLKGFIEEIVAEIQPYAMKTHNEIKFETTRDIRVLADRLQLKRVIKNLISNAISYGKSNSPIIIKIGEIPNYITISVKDFGAGISKENIEKIFNKYYSASKKFRKIGTGLGLYLSKQIIESHDGELLVDSKISEYTEFTVKLPAVINVNLHYGE